MGVVVLSLNEALTQEVQSDVWSLIIFYLKEIMIPDKKGRAMAESLWALIL